MAQRTSEHACLLTGRVPFRPCSLRPGRPLPPQKPRDLPACRCSAAGRGPERPRDGGVPPVSFGSQAEEQRYWARRLWAEVTSLETMVREPLEAAASPEALGAMRAAVTGLLGALPSPQFQVTLRAPHDQLESLLLSMMCTGYCLRNAEFEAELEKKWEAASASQAPRLAEEERAALSPETAAYIKFLEARPQSIETSTRGASQLLLAVSREPCIKDVAQLTKVAGDCIPEAFHAVANKIIVRLKVSQAGSPRMTFMDHVMTGCCQFTSDHGLPQLDIGTSICFGRERMMEVLMWCLLVGYYAKDVEYRTTLERCMFRGKEVPKVVEQEKLPSGRAWLDRLSGFFTQGL